MSQLARNDDANSKLGLGARDFKDTAEYVRSLFRVSMEDWSPESRLEARLSRVVRDFLSTDKTGSFSTIEELAQQVMTSRMPDEPSDVDQYVGHLATSVIPHCVYTSSPRFIGHMTSALPWFVRPLSTLMAALNQNMVKIETSKVLSVYERQAIAMLHRELYGLAEGFYEKHLQLGSSTLGIVVSGGTVANLTALWCARNTSLGPRGSFGGIEKEG